MLSNGSANKSSGLRNSLKILEVVSSSETGITFSNLRKETGNLPSATASRLLKVLMEENWVNHNDNGHYTPGDKFKHCGYRITSGVNSVRQLEPVIRKLAYDTKESAAFVEWTSEGIVFRLKQEMPSSYHYMDIGKNNSDFFGNGFNVLALAYQEEDVFVSACKRKEVAVENAKALSNKIRSDAFHISRDLGVRFLAPVFAGKTKIFAGVIGISCLVRDFTPEQMEEKVNLVKQAAREASAMLGVRE